MSVVPGSRSIHYSADAAGRAGRATCQVVQTHVIAGGRMSYSIVVHNDSSNDVHACAFVPDTLDVRHWTIVQSVIGPYSEFSTNVDIDLARYASPPDVHLELSGEDVRFALVVPRFVVDVPADSGVHRIAAGALAVRNGSGPQTALPMARAATLPRSHAEAGGRDAARSSPAVLPMFVVFAAIVAAVGVAVVRPQVRDLAVPQRARPATSIPIPYRATGFGEVRYTVIAPDAEPIAGGLLAKGFRTFAIRLPQEPSDRAYLVRVEIGGPFGSALAEEYVKVEAPAVRAATVAPPVRTPSPVLPPQIRSFALDRATLAGGDTLNVYYDVSATSGNIAFLDGGAQIAYGRSALSNSGHTALVVPAVQTERSLSVVLTALRGTQTAQSRVAVTVVPQSSPTPADADTTSAIPPVIFTPKTVSSARNFEVGIRSAVDRLVLILIDEKGAELARREVTPSETSATFTAPAVRTRTRVHLEGTYERGAGSETIVQTIDVTPH